MINKNGSLKIVRITHKEAEEKKIEKLKSRREQTKKMKNKGKT